LIVAGLAPTADSRPTNVVGRVLIVPGEADPQALRKRLGSGPHAALIVQGRKCDMTLCSIRRQASLEVAANEIIEGVEVYKELANRLHTRVDMTWRPFQRAEASNYGSVESADSPEPTHTVVLSRPQSALEIESAESLVCSAVVPGAR
jgi:hypothetical protein